MHRQALLAATCHLLLALRHPAAAQDPPVRLVQRQGQATLWLTGWLCSHPQQQQASPPEGSSDIKKGTVCVISHAEEGLDGATATWGSHNAQPEQPPVQACCLTSA